MIRLFLGFAPPPELRLRLAGLCHGLPGARWVPEQNLHLTLHFLGEITEPAADALDLALSRLPMARFRLGLLGCGLFPGSGRSQTLWAGLTPSPALLHLHQTVGTLLERQGLPSDNRRYHPHVTLARLDGKTAPARLQAYLSGQALFRADWDVTELRLYSSWLGHGDPLYRTEACYPLDETVEPDGVVLEKLKKY